jgi:type IX secretion system PorP/SprF family membrane protein
METAVAQDEPQFSQYMAAPVLFNPGAAGLEDAWITSVHIRSQWVNIPGAPQTQALISQLPVYRLRGGISLQVANDQVGQQQTTRAVGGYSWHLPVGKATLGLGVYGGIAARTLDGSKLIAPQGSYESVVDHNDNLLPTTLETAIIPDAGAGVFYQGRRLAAGASVTHLLNNSFQFSTPEAVASIQYSPNAYVFVSYQLLRSEKFSLVPNVLYKSDFTESMVDLNALFTYNDALLAGVSYRGYLNQQADAVVAIGGWNFSEFWSIRYSYDITLSELNNASAGSHEVVLMYRYPVQRPRAGKEINNLRYLYY